MKMDPNSFTNSKVLRAWSAGNTAKHQRAADLRRKNEDLAKRVDHIEEQVRGVPRMTANARDALKDPVAAAFELYKLMPLSDRAREVRAAILEYGSYRKAAKMLTGRGVKMSQSTVSRIVRDEIRPAYEKAGIPVENVFLQRPSNSFRKTPGGDVYKNWGF